MPIHIILGKPGSGKSLYATSRVIRELRESKRNIVTNLPLRPGVLNEYLQRAYPEENIRFAQRVRILTDEEMRKFWLYRGPESIGETEPVELPEFRFTAIPGESAVEEQARFMRERGIYAQRQAEHERQCLHFRDPGGDPMGREGVAYFLDEAHIAFNARDWASLGREALNYLSQHRKLGDIVWPITQAPGNLDKQFRSVAEDFTVLRNEYTAKYGIFRGRGRFVRKTYLAEPSNNAEPFETASFTLDKEGIAACYDTAKGIGVHGTNADIGRRAKGISIMWVIPCALILAGLCVLLPWLLGKGASKFIAGDASPAAKKVAAASAASAEPEAIDAAVSLPTKVFPEITEGKETGASELRVTGVVRRGGMISIYLSDGRMLIEGGPEWVSLDRSGLVLASGVKVPYAPAFVPKRDVRINVKPVVEPVKTPL